MARKFLVLISAVLLALVGGGCDQKAILQRATPKADDQLAREFIEHIRVGHLDKAEAMLIPTSRTPEAKHGLAQLFILFKQGQVKSLEIIGLNAAGTIGGGQSTHLSYQLQLSTGWFAGGVLIVQGEDRKPYIQAARFDPIPDSLDNMNRFSFSGKGPRHSIMAGLCLAVPLFIVAVVIVCLFSRVRMKWLWVFGMLWGFGSLHLNWATGQITYQSMSVRLLGASCLKMGLMAPWVLSVSFPAVAVVFLCLRRKLQSAGAIPVLPAQN